MNNLKLFTISQIIHNSWHQTYNSSIWACSVLFGCVVYQKLHSSLYSFQNLNEIVWKKSEKFGYEAQPSIQIFSLFFRLFHSNSEKSTRMSAISDKQHNLTELSMLRCSFCSAALYTTVKNLRNCEQFEKLWIISNCSL